MLLAASEGRHSRYEVCEHADGYLVQMRDLDTGELETGFATIFRTMPVAFAYAEMSAAFDRYAAAEGEELEEEDEDVAFELEERERIFVDLSHRLSDAGFDGSEPQPLRRDPQPSLTLH